MLKLVFFRASLCSQLPCEFASGNGLLQPNKRGLSIGSVGVYLAIFFPSHGSFFFIILYISYQPLVQNGFFFFLGEDMREGIFGIFIPTVEVPLGQKAIC